MRYMCGPLREAAKLVRLSPVIQATNHFFGLRLMRNQLHQAEPMKNELSMSSSERRLIFKAAMELKQMAKAGQAARLPASLYEVKKLSVLIPSKARIEGNRKVRLLMLKELKRAQNQVKIGERLTL